MKMKNILKSFAILALLAVAAPALSSCSNDDDEEVAAVESIIGVYSGSINTKVMGIVCNTPGEFQVKITKEPRERDEVVVELPECTFENDKMGKRTIPALTIREVEVSKTNGGYKISSDLFKVVQDGVSYTVLIEGTITGKNANIMYNITPGDMPMVINFAFNGNR